MSWNLTADRPIFSQIMDIISQNIISGKYAPGEKLPSVRDLAAQAAVNPNTMQKALSELEKTGLVFAKRTSGRYITEDITMIEKLKSQLAQKKIEEFLFAMESLGISRKETAAIMTDILEGEKQA
ncbi:MAG: GntR family transcriptional regulator [Roseburia sp.]|nr:GntR family transcriptional regulator [Roseburia sp.]